jgi:DNA-binding transcriptional regulator YhcF (GntR family)
MPQPRYKQLVDRLADDIRAGRLRPGTRLPTHRDLAAREGLEKPVAARSSRRRSRAVKALICMPGALTPWI